MLVAKNVTPASDPISVGDSAFSVLLVIVGVPKKVRIEGFFRNI